MNSNHDHDGALLDQIDRALEYGIPAEDALVNHLADTMPQASLAFQRDLEQRLMAQVASSQPRKPKDKNIMHLFASASAMPRMPRSTATWGTSWAFTLAAVALIAIVLLNWNRVWLPVQLASPPGQLDTPVQIVIATQDIPAGTLITAEMIGTITVPAKDFAKLTAAQPGHEFLSDVAAVVEQTAAIDILWFQAIETRLLGEVVDACDLPDAKCPGIPESYYPIDLPLQPDTVQGLGIGDRVDVLASIDGELRMVTANVLLADITPTMVTLAAPSWQHSILVWLYQSRTSYAL